jgi:hypothetical protein
MTRSGSNSAVTRITSSASESGQHLVALFGEQGAEARTLLLLGHDQEHPGRALGGCLAVVSGRPAGCRTAMGPVRIRSVTASVERLDRLAL